ncbi:MAG: helix-turn-helix transcriptional regulator [Turicibacter sp.]|nr:helix-turn-helix transcriptional regulator [Turicibacter sp.]
MNEKQMNFRTSQGHHLGLYIKEARLRQGYRLTEVAQGICAVSLLSRIESGTFEPTPTIFEKLSRRLDLTFPTQHRRDPIETFRTLLCRREFEKLEQLLVGDDLFDYEKALLEFLLSVEKQDVAKALQLKKMIDKWAEHLNPREKQMYTLFHAMDCFSRQEWEAGVNFLEMSYRIALEKGIEDPLLLMALGKYYVKIGRVHLGFTFLEEAYQLLQKFLAQKLMVACLVVLCEEYIKIGEYDVATRKLAQIERLLDLEASAGTMHDYLRLSGQIAEGRGDRVVAERIFAQLRNEKHIRCSSACLEALVDFYYRAGRMEVVRELIAEVEVQKLNNRMKMWLEYYYYKITDTDVNDFELFLLDDAIPIALQDLDVAHATMYLKDLIVIYEGKKSHKGVALTYRKLEQFRNRLEQMRTIQAV